MKAMNVLLFFWLFMCQPVLGFEISYPGEEGFFIGVPLPYVVLDSETQEMQAGMFVFGKSKVMIEGVEYYDCVFDSETTNSHFYFGLDEQNEALMFKGLTTGITELQIVPAVSVVHYPLSVGEKWQEETTILGKNVEIPNLGVLPSLTIADVFTQTTVANVNIVVPAGEFSTLCVETNFSGNVLNIPLSLILRTWLSAHNITIRRTIDFLFMSKTIPVLDMQLLVLDPSACQPVDKLAGYWGRIRND